MQHIQTIKGKEQQNIHRMGSDHLMQYVSHENVLWQSALNDETTENKCKNKEAEMHVCFFL